MPAGPRPAGTISRATRDHGEPLAEASDLEVVYDHIILALHGVSLRVPERSIVALLGGNGAGKSTTLKAISGLLAAENGAVTRGTIRYRGEPTQGRSPAVLVRAGLAHVLEGRHCFPHLSVEDNLIAGALSRRPGRRALRDDLERIYGYFPQLIPLRTRPAGLGSGGEQQMVAIGRALMARPRLILLDEPSLGLAPQIVHAIFEIIRTLRDRDGVSFLIAEQNARLALGCADHGYVLENGRVVADGTAAELGARRDVAAFYLGTGLGSGSATGLGSGSAAGSGSGAGSAAGLAIDRGAARATRPEAVP